MNLKNIIKLDWAANNGNGKGRFVVFFFRVANHLSSSKNLIVRILGAPIVKFYRIFIVWICGIEIPEDTAIGHSFQVWHGQALVINKATILGNNVLVRHSTTIGNKGGNSGSPIIGNNVDIGAHSVIIGNITIGDNVKIGAGTVITKSIPRNCIAYGNPLVIKPILL